MQVMKRHHHNRPRGQASGPKNGIKNYQNRINERKAKFRTEVGENLDHLYNEMLDITSLPDLPLASEKFCLHELILKEDLLAESSNAAGASTRSDDENATYLSLKVRAERILQILEQVRVFVPFLSASKANTLLDSLNVLRQVPMVNKILCDLGSKTDITAAPESSRETNQDSFPDLESRRLQDNLSLAWQEETEGKGTFRNREAFESYKKAREAVLKAASYSNTLSSAPAVKFALQTTVASGNLIKFSFFLTRPHIFARLARRNHNHFSFVRSHRTSITT